MTPETVMEVLIPMIIGLCVLVVGFWLWVVAKVFREDKHDFFVFFVAGPILIYGLGYIIQSAWEWYNV